MSLCIMYRRTWHFDYYYMVFEQPQVPIWANLLKTSERISGRTSAYIKYLSNGKLQLWLFTSKPGTKLYNFQWNNSFLVTRISNKVAYLITLWMWGNPCQLRVGTSRVDLLLRHRTKPIYVIQYSDSVLCNNIMYLLFRWNLNYICYWDGRGM